MLYLAVVSVALTAGLLVVLFAAVIPSRTRAVRNRMVALGLHGSASVEELAGRSRARTRRFEDLLKVLGERLTPRWGDWSRLRRRLIHAGYRDRAAIPVFVGIQVAGVAGLFVIGTMIGILLELSTTSQLLVGIWGAVIGWFVPRFLLSLKITRRQKELTKALPDALDLLVICVEAGLGLNQALVRVASEMRHVSFTMTEEIAQANLEIRAGTPRDQALLAMADRTGVPDIRSLVTMLIQTERFGTSIARSLRVHSDTLRTKRRQRAEEAAAKTAIKMVFPLVLCVFPALFVVILGPALIQIFQSFGGV